MYVEHRVSPFFSLMLRLTSGSSLWNTQKTRTVLAYPIPITNVSQPGTVPVTDATQEAIFLDGAIAGDDPEDIGASSGKGVKALFESGSFTRESHR
jgi:hypothetical protein